MKVGQLAKAAAAWLAMLWAAVLPLAAYAAGHSDGSASSSSVFALSVYQIGSVICHQRPERSFRVAAVPMAVCARCAGIYGGAALTSAAMLAFWRKRSAPVSGTAGQTSKAVDRAPISAFAARWLLVSASIPAVLTLLYEWTIGQTPSNELRALTGIVLGAAAAWVVLHVE